MPDQGGLHPELARIRREYQELYDSVQAGAVSEEEARDLLRNITALDGDGAVWSFDPYTGEFTRALPGLPSQQAAPSLFAPSRLPASGSLSSDPEQPAGPPLPSLTADDYPPGSYDEEFPPRGDRQPVRTRQRRTLPPGLRPFIRPLVGLMVVGVLAAVMLSSRQPAEDLDQVVAPPQTAPVQDPQPAVEDPEPVPAVPAAPNGEAFLPPQVRFDADGALLPLTQQDVLRMLQGFQSAESGMFYLLADRWVDAYALPILGASAGGWEIAIEEWVVDSSGRDRLTLTLRKSSFPQELRWWAFVEPQGGFWLVSELTPLPGQ